MKKGDKKIIRFVLVFVLIFAVFYFFSVPEFKQVFFAPEDYLRGDCNGDGVINLFDITRLNVYINSGGIAPYPLEVANVNGDNIIDQDDSTYLLNYTNFGGPTPMSIAVNTSVGLVRGDCYQDGFIGDIDVLFLNDYLNSGGVAPNPLELGNVDGNNIIDQADIDYLNNSLHAGGPAPVALDITISNPVRGDVTKDGFIGDLDIVFLIDFLNKGGPAPYPLELGNVNGDGVVNMFDITYLSSYIHKGGSVPVAIGENTSGELIRGDVNKDGFIGDLDVELIQNYLSGVRELYHPIELANVNADDILDSSDVDYLNDFLHNSGSGPVAIEENTSSDLLRCDANKDGFIGDLDIDFLMNYLYKGGSIPYHLGIADCNADGQVTIHDITYLDSYLYKGGPTPVLYCESLGEEKCEGRISFVCEGFNVWENKGEVIGKCGVTSNHGNGGTPSVSRINIIISSPRNITYAYDYEILLQVKDEKNNAKYWKYSLNNGAQVGFIPGTDYAYPVLGANVLQIYASESASFSTTKSKIVNFNVIQSTSNYYCGDGVCNMGEDCLNCQNDCGLCSITLGSYCGDGICDSDENFDNCSEDCEQGEEPKNLKWLLVVLIALFLVAISVVVVLIVRRARKIKEYKQVISDPWKNKQLVTNTNNKLPTDNTNNTTSSESYSLDDSEQV
ncbi:MAG: hypothetical protein KKF48_02855 [Nanoarchaeota archaeon]|nr:hypothetical protein [Nanoarchaeota archaeon]MBU1027962.1 hypothetical protein [Nanoarchaeota archaeon]